MNTQPATNGQRVPPNSLEAEQSLLGSMLLSSAAIVTALDEVKTTDYYREAHQRIHAAIDNLFTHSPQVPVDLTTLGNALEERGELEKTGGRAYLAQLLDVVPTAENVSYYAEIVREKAVRRALILASRENMETAYDERDGATAEDAAALCEARIREAGARATSGDVVALEELCLSVANLINGSEKPAAGEVRVGLPSVDRILDAFLPGDTAVIAADTGLGKTALGAQIAVHTLRRGMGVLYWSGEMPSRQVIIRMASQMSRVDPRKMRRGCLNKEDAANLSGAVSEIAGLPLEIDDRSGCTPGHIMARARGFKGGKLGLVVVDYIGLLRLPDRIENRNQELGEISKSLKALASELGVVVLCLAQLRRQPAGQGKVRKTLEDIRDSGEVANDAGAVLIIRKGEGWEETVNTYDRWSGKVMPNRPMVIDVAKNRHGDMGETPISYAPWHTRFYEVEDERA